MTDVITSDDDAFTSLDSKWRDGDRRRAKWKGDDPPDEGDLLVANGAVYEVDGTGSSWFEHRTKTRYVYLDPTDRDAGEVVERLPLEERPTWARDDVETKRMRANPGEGTVVDVSGDGDWKTVLGGHWTCNECGGKLKRRRSKCSTCGLYPSDGIGVTFHAEVRDATDDEERVAESERRRQTLRRVGKAATENHREAVFHATLDRIKGRDDLVKTSANPWEKYVGPEKGVDDEERIATLRDHVGGRTSTISEVTLGDGREGYKYSFGNRFVFFVPEDVRRAAVIDQAKRIGWTPEGCREWLEEYEGCAGENDRRLIANLDDDSELAQDLRRVDRIYQSYLDLADLLETDTRDGYELTKRLDDEDRVEGDRYEIHGGVEVKRARSSDYLVISDDEQRLEYKITNKSARVADVEAVDGNLDEIRALAAQLDEVADGQ